MAEPLPDAVRLRLATSLVFVRPVRKMVEALLAAQGWEEEAIEDAGLVFTEVLQNAIEHGSRCDGSESVDVLCRVDEDDVVFEVTDPGTGKDPADVIRRDVTLPIPPEEPRGRGLFLIHRMARRLERSLAVHGGVVIRVRVGPSP
jgi:anti-sigma regulatory factor (Ser/Thr protein kinase)